MPIFLLKYNVLVIFWRENMTHQEIEVFLAVVRTGSVSGAAQAL